ncbi:hypothetical protein [Lacticaseibacillus hulanensis]|uniref:hypothetical protein n=1 Tax=Lacticaseibacillus hulanensis TaxID=2493111 RepID=UPI000FDC0316|nr:hypothetical protein [Lacticaseibacillus hulanensis]
MSKHKENRIPKEQAQLFNDFVEQLDYISVAADNYDEGHTSRIKMAAPHLRSLFYKSQTSHPLIDKISVVDRNKFVDTTMPDKSSFIYTGPLIIDNTAANKGSYTYYPGCYINSSVYKFISFEDWWHGEILAQGGEIFSRKDIVAYITNQDGGAHVDTALSERYYNLLSGLYSATVSDENVKNVPVDEISFALLRQISYECIASFKSMHFPLKVKLSTGKDSLLDQRRIGYKSGSNFIDASFTWL